MHTGVERELTAALSAQWDELWSRDCAATPFTSRLWCQPWWAHWSHPDDELWLVTVRDGAELVGLAPLLRRSRGPLRLLYGLGSGVGNYWDVVACPGRRAEVLAAVSQALVERAGQWDALSLDRLPPGSETPELLASHGLRVHARPPNAAPAIALPASWDDYLQQISYNRRHKVRRALKDVDHGRLRATAVTDPDAVADAVAHWQRLRVAWWAARDRDLNPEHASARFLEFTTEVMTAMVPRGLATVTQLEDCGRLVGVSLDLQSATTFYSWLDGVDPRAARQQLGHTFIALTIRASIAAGRSCYDFMLGTEPYKYGYGAVDRPLPNILVNSRHPRSRLAGHLYALRRRTGQPS